MQPRTDDEYQKLLSEVIKKQIVILGPDITLAKARNVAGLTVEDDGTVTHMAGNPQELTKKLIEEFMELSGLIVKKTMEPLLANYPEYAGSQAGPSSTFPYQASPMTGLTPPPTPPPPQGPGAGPVNPVATSPVDSQPTMTNNNPSTRIT